MGGEWKAGRGGATLFLQCKTSHKLRYRWLDVKPYLCRVLHPIHRVLGAGFVVGPPMEVNLAQPVGPAERPPGQHWKPKQRKRLHCRNGSCYAQSSNLTPDFSLRTVPYSSSQAVSDGFPFLWSTTESLTCPGYDFQNCIYVEISGLWPTKGYGVVTGLSCYGLDISQ